MCRAADTHGNLAERAAATATTTAEQRVGRLSCDHVMILQCRSTPAEKTRIYRSEAARLRMVAEQVSDPEIRKSLLQMAETYLELAITFSVETVPTPSEASRDPLTPDNAAGDAEN